MALQVWLPLKGDLNNQGLSKINMTGTPTWKTSGKIGGSALNLSSRISFTCPELNGIKYFSVCFWGMIEPNSDSTANWMDVFSLTDKSTSGTIGYFRFETGYGNTAYGGIHWHDNATNAIINGSYTYNTATEQNKWHHICVTISPDKICSYYDGILKQIHTSNLGGGSLTGVGWIGESTTRGGIQDLRIYDHCLSVKEVEEISKGLILHYKLDDPYVESSSFLTSEITNTAYNSPISKYGYNETSNLGKVNGYFQGKYCTKVYTLTDDQTSQPYAYFSNLFTSNGTKSPAYKTLSFDYYTTVPTTTWLNIYKLGNGSGTATWKTTNSQGIKSGVYTNSSNSILVQPGEWNHVEVTFQGTTSEDAQWGYCINGPRYTSNSNYYFLYANIQLEVNDHATGYGERMHSNIIYDSSGYGNNGIVNGALSLNSDTAKYSISTSFDGATRIERTTLGPEIKTLSCWARTSKNKSTSQQMVSDSASALTISFYNGTIIGVFGTTRGTGSKCILGDSYKENDWNHFVVVKTGDSGERNIYCNGVQLTPTSNDYWSAATGFWVGARNSSNGNPFFGEICDVRAYVTALTDKQVKELYNISTTVDKNGNMYGRELIE